MIALGLAGLLLIGASATTAPVAGEPADAGPGNATEHHVDITSDEMTIVPGSHQAIAVGHVHAVGTTFVADCDHGEATYGESNGKHRSIEQMVMHDHVHMRRFSDGAIGESELATYTAATKIVVMTGNPVLTRGLNVLHGDVITMSLDDNWMEATQPKADMVRPTRPEPIHIRAEHMTAVDGGKHLHFDHNVHLTKGNMTARSDRLEAEVDDVNSDEGSKVSEMVLVGHVVSHRGNQESTSGRAVYNGDTGDVTLLDHPVVTEDGTVTTGDVIVVDGATGHAHARGHPEVVMTDDSGRDAGPSPRKTSAGSHP